MFAHGGGYHRGNNNNNIIFLINGLFARGFSLVSRARQHRVPGGVRVHGGLGVLFIRVQLAAANWSVPHPPRVYGSDNTRSFE